MTVGECVSVATKEEVNCTAAVLEENDFDAIEEKENAVENMSSGEVA